MRAPPSVFAASILLACLAPSFARAQQESPSPSAERPTFDNHKEARDLYAKGQLHYSLGEYDQAIAQFRRAYELTSAPGLLFNIAQAHRLAGQCKQALEVYRHFIRLVPNSEYRAEADMQVASLVLRCGAAPPPPPSGDAALPAKSEAAASQTLQAIKQDLEPPARPPWSVRRRTATALLVGGAAVGVAAGILNWWNDGRHDQWREEDRRLAEAPPGTPYDPWIADQQRNDALLASIERADSINVALASLSVAAVLTSAILVVLFDR